MYQYLYDGVYHTDTSTQYLADLGAVEDEISAIQNFAAQHLEKIRNQKAVTLKRDRHAAELAPINGISVEKESHRTDVKEYSDLIEQYRALDESEQSNYSGMINADGTIDWLLADETVRAVTAAELRDAYQYFFVRKGVLMLRYQSAMSLLFSKATDSIEKINEIKLES